MTTRTRTLSLAMICLMVFSTTLVHAATISTFANGNSDVDVELRDQGTWGDDLTAGISMPAGETVNAAGFIVATDHAEHNDVQVIDSSLIANGEIWNPIYNGGMTQYSSVGDFTVEETSLQLKSQGYNADFESGAEGWTTGPEVGVPPMVANWARGHQDDNVLPTLGCGVGDYCWGTDFENPDYTASIPDGEFEMTLTSVSFFVHPGKADMTFRSFHSFFFREAGTNQYYYDDCAYVAVQNSTNNVDFQNPVFAPFDIGSTTGVSSGDGLHQLGTSTNQVPAGRCGNHLGTSGPQTGDYVLAGNGSTSANSPSGWSDIRLDLSQHQGRYIKLIFIHEVNPRQGAFPVEMLNAGWYIDGVRVGDPLPAQGDVTLRSFAPQASGQPGFPDGYGLLDLDLITSASADFGVDVLDAGTGNVVMDRNGNALSNLQGSLIELWDINADTYPLIDFRFTFGSGSSRLATPVLHGFNLGTIVGSTFNNTDGVFFEGGTYGGDKWVSSMSGGSQVMISTQIVDNSFTPPVMRQDFSMPVVAVKPVVVDNCGGPNFIMGFSLNSDADMTQLTNNQWTELASPTFTLGVLANYTSYCDVYSFHAEYRFAHHSRGITLDVAADGDVEWGMTDPGFGRFGRQDMFRTGVVNGTNEGSPSRTISLDINLQGEGAPFLLPKGATIHYAEFNYENNNIGEFDLNLVSGNEEVTLASSLYEGTNHIPYPGSPLVSLQSSVQTLLDNPLVPVAWVDEYGNEWCLFRLAIDAPTSTSGATITFRDLDIIYDWQRALSDSNNIAREMNQGVALASSGGAAETVVVPIRVVGGSGGSISLSSLSISTTSGYDSTYDDGGITGMYPNGDIIEIVTTHDVSSSTGQTLGGASLLFETETGNMELRWDQSNGSFWEESDVEDKINFMALQSIASTVDGSSAMQLNWRFTVNPSWDDTPSVRLYAAAISSTGVSGLPAGNLIQPSTGNAVENDAGITDFHLFNQGGVEQMDLNNAFSSNTITLDFNVQYEDLDVAPNPNSYEVVLQKRNQSEIMFEDWLFVDSTAPSIDGDYSWQPTLPASEAGNEQYRLLMHNYTDGDTICPPANFNPDGDCAIRFSITLDPFAPHLMNISVFSVQGDWRELSDDTWVKASNNQKFRIAAQDLPLAPETLTLNYWVEYSADCGLDGLCPTDPGYTAADTGEKDRIAQMNEYSQVGLVRQTMTDTSYYLIDHPCECISDYANSGIDPPQMVSLYVSGGDIGGNQIDGGVAGINEDLVTYIAMESRTPLVEAFHISDSHGTLLNENNRSIYAGNVYHLLVDGKDDNGWQDIDKITVTMNPAICNEAGGSYDPEGCLELFYSPQNDTAWTNGDNDWIEILDDFENTGLKPRMLTREGTVLISPFEQQFTLDIPIRLDWGVPLSYVGGVKTPDVAMKDKDLNNNEVHISASRNPQRWSYASGIELDMTTFQVEDTSGFPTDGVGEADGGFVYQGDLLVIEGRYVFSAGMNDLIFVSPEIPITLQITRSPLYPAGMPDKGYSPALVDVNEYDIENGTFQLVVPAAYASNEYSYTMELLNLPEGAADNTPAPSRSFIVKVDATRPNAVVGSWDLSNSVTGETIEGSISSSVMGCLDAEILIDELQGMDTNSVNLNWMFYKTQEVGGFEYNWTEYLNAFEDGPGWESTPLYLESSQGRIRATSTCFDLWDTTQPVPDDMENVIVKFWLTGYDSAGQTIAGAGSFGESVNGEAQYQIAYESAQFSISRVDMSVDRPMAESDFDLLIDFSNEGNKEGVLEIQIVTWIGGEASAPISYTCPFSVLPGEDTRWRISMDQFPNPATNVSYVILDMDNEEIASIPAFNVAKYSDAEDSSNTGLYIGIAGVVIVLIIAVVVVLLVLNRTVEDDELEYIEEDDFLPAAQPVTPMESRGPPATRPGERRGPPGASRKPPAATKSPMDIAKEKFPFWDEATIQGYFDQGWNIEQLEEWLASQE